MHQVDMTRVPPTLRRVLQLQHRLSLQNVVHFHRSSLQTKGWSSNASEMDAATVPRSKKAGPQFRWTVQRLARSIAFRNGLLPFSPKKRPRTGLKQRSRTWDVILTSFFAETFSFSLLGSASFPFSSVFENADAGSHTEQ